MTRTVHPPKPLTPDDRLGQITRQPASDFVHPPLECLMLVLTGKIFPEHTDHRCGDARYNGAGLPRAVNLLPPGVAVSETILEMPSDDMFARSGPSNSAG